MSKKTAAIIPEVIENKIFLIRGKKVMLDKDLAALYAVPTKALNQAVKRNLERFPADFMFRLNKSEISRSQFVTLKKGSGFNIKYLPRAFTEHGILMLSSVLGSPRAVQVNIQIMRIFTRLRKFLLTHKDLQLKIEQLISAQEKQRSKLLKHDQYIDAIFEAIKQLLQNDELIRKQLTYEEEKQKNKKWGFVPNSERK